jgi:hypothetical protein
MEAVGKIPLRAWRYRVARKSVMFAKFQSFGPHDRGGRQSGGCTDKSRLPPICLFLPHLCDARQFSLAAKWFAARD